MGFAFVDVKQQTSWVQLAKLMTIVVRLIAKLQLCKKIDISEQILS